MKILVVNGPNINMIGIREPDVYGKKNYNDLLNYISEAALNLNIDVECFQSNHEGDIIDKIQAAYGNFDGIIINPAAYTHTSIGILDALQAINLPVVEVHISDISSREEFRKHSFISLISKKTIIGKGFEGYRIALEFFAK